jgi:hypothetical protein
MNTAFRKVVISDCSSHSGQTKIYLWSSSLLIVFDYMISEFLSQTGAIRDTVPAIAVSGIHILARLIDRDSLIVQVRCEVEKKDITLDTALDRHTQMSNL